MNCLLQQVIEELQNARDNGEDFADMTDEQVAEDIINYCADFNDYTAEQLTPVVHEARKGKH